MAIAGNNIPSLKFHIVEGALRAQGQTQQRPVQVCFSTSPAGMGTMQDAAARLLNGATVCVDMRGGAFLELQKALKEAGA